MTASPPSALPDERLPAGIARRAVRYRGRFSPETIQQPAAEVEPLVAQVLTDAGVDLTDTFPKPLTDEVVQAVDIVITMVCGDICPIVPGRCLDRPVTDPEGAPIAVVRGIRDEIDAHIIELLDSLPGT
ncbi:hypothetical protein [Streptomyces sp. R41]|uniref:Phosphotyrosine protein phosphatase I domain-containing protein n=1 Tax=Streptomyces sp. R41 TaxID=3238632 RepID=A0AB39RE51_9ACTN